MIFFDALDNNDYYYLKLYINILNWESVKFGKNYLSYYLCGEYNVFDIDIRIVNLLIDNCPYINILDEDGNTFLHLYFNYYNEPNIDIIKLLIDSGININVKNNNGNSVLHVYFYYYNKPNIDIIKLLIDSGIDINITNNNGDTLLHTYFDKSCDAVFNYELIELLVNSGINLYNTDVDNITPIHMYLLNNITIDIHILKVLLSGIILKDDKFKDLLYIYITKYRPDYDIIYILSKHGLKYKDELGNNALMMYMYNNNYDFNIKTVKLIIEKCGGDINFSNNNGDRPIDYYLKFNYNITINIIKDLIKMGTTVNKDTRLMKSCLFNGRNVNIDIIKYIYDITFTYTNYNKENLLHIYLENAINTNVVDFIIHNYKESINDINSKGLYPIHAAIGGYSSTKVIEHLIKLGSDINLLTNDGKTTLLFALKRKDEIIKLLLNYKPSITTLRKTINNLDNISLEYNIESFIILIRYILSVDLEFYNILHKMIIYNNNKNIMMYVDKCYNELLNIKKIQINSYISMSILDIIFKYDKNTACKYIKLCPILPYKKFPLYSNVINTRIYLLIKRHKLLNNVIECTQKSNNIWKVIPNEIKLIIFSYISDKDLLFFKKSIQ
ncbi:ankyrin repeat and PRANC domain-containing protein [Cotia virus SPAn232]|uniref:Ankyrin repeat and PRANC domain-containing protein n=2 Tax=Cotia virus TaxID=39444 RepID=H6TAD2_9POXV|nr:ankyrin repeat and PRANC domain-containing protein [Cotia virus SPAn232]AFB76966.1 ankyrin repeat and PRANC domain-containing protein [Cotia virus SPAn232]AIT70779.1 ankyrin repeat and PRANC domain-containing protein [Cotia virus]